MTGQFRPNERTKEMSEYQPNYLSPFEVRQSILFGNKLAAEIDKANNVKPGFRFEAATRHLMQVSSRRDAASFAIKTAVGEYREVEEAITHINTLARTKPSYTTPLY